MRRRSAVFHLSLSLAGVTAGILLLAQSLNLLPDAQATLRAARAGVSESIATQCALVSREKDGPGAEAFIRAMMLRQPDLLSAAVLNASGRVTLEVGDHVVDPVADQESSTPTMTRVALLRDGKRFGTLELRFAAPTGGILQFLFTPAARLIYFVTLAGFLASLLILRRSLKHLDPSTVIPDRVRQMLDTLTESVMVIDDKQRIVLANASFLKLVEEPLEELLGRDASALPCWLRPEGAPASGAPPRLPWVATLKSRQPQIAIPLRMRDGSGHERSMIVNAGPILNGDGGVRGVLVTLDDLTPVEQKNVELQRTLEMLEASKEKIKQQNLELQALATIDPLTGCVNRRSLYTSLEMQWASAKRYGHAISCVIADVDHFKSINDQHGHGVGDKVLQQVARILRETARASDTVCRYGGEEFLVLMPHTDIEAAKLAAERFRAALAAAPVAGVPVTASFGASSVELGAANPQVLIEQSDKALYRSKHAGRNRVTAWDVTCEQSSPEDPSEQASDENETRQAIPFRVVTALMDLMSHRDGATAQHSMRVADICVLLGGEVLPPEQRYFMELAAMLHDIGKLGVPDAVLLKPAELDDDERRIMDAHDRLGVQIIRSALGSAEVAHFVECHHAFYGGNPRRPELPTGEDIPLPSRLIAIADAFDAMVSDRPYRQGCSREAAFNELRRCAGTQFDPALVGRFIEMSGGAAVLAADRSLAA